MTASRPERIGTGYPTQPTVPLSIRHVVMAVVGLVLLVGGMTVLYLAMRSVMSIGGACASGGPYQIARPCPEGMAALMPIAIIGGVIGLFLYIAGVRRLPGPRLYVLAWPALFLSLGWNFLDFGLNPPVGSGPVWGWIVCAVVFFVMGVAPLALLTDRATLRAVFWSDGPGAAPVQPPAGLQYRPGPPLQPTTGAPSAPASQPEPDDDVVDALERLNVLHSQGALSDEEFQAAKRQILGDA